MVERSRGPCYNFPTPPSHGPAGALTSEVAIETKTYRGSAMSNELFRVTRDGAVNLIELFVPMGLDIQEFDRLIEAVLGAIDRDRQGAWVVDLAGMEHVGSASLGLLVNIRQHVKESRGRLVLCGLSPRLLQVFQTCCMERLFRIVRTREEAIDVAAW